jgi:iron(III) transport system substrate-binding protein
VTHRGAASLRRVGALLALAACCAAILSGCGGSSPHSTITLYNGQHAELTSLLVAAFEKKTGIKVKIRTNDSAVLAAQIAQEGDASPADVYIAENSPELMELQRRGLLAPLPRSILDEGTPAANSPTGAWVGMALRVSSLVYAPSRAPLSQLPDSLLDLARPEWKGKVAVAPTDSDFPPLVGAVIATKGEAAARAWLAGLERNARVYQDEEAVVAAVNRGDIATGLINSYYWYRLQLELGTKAMHSALYYFSPNDPGAAVNISGAAVLGSSKEQQNAQRFVSFLVGKAGQQIIAASDDFEYLVRRDVAPNKLLPPIATIHHTTPGVAALGNGELAARLIRQAGLI